MIRRHVVLPFSCGLVVAALVALGCATGGGGARIEDREKARAQYDLGVDHLRQGNPALAVRDLLAAQALDPADPWIQHGLAAAYRRQGRHAEAEQHLLRALELDPKLQVARLDLSGVYLESSRFEEAIAQARKLVDDPTYPTPWKAYSNMGWAQQKLGRREEARRSLELALQFKDGYWPAALNLGILENEEGHRAEAIARFQQVLAAAPGPHAESEANFRVAEVYIALGERDRAVGHLTAAVEQRPSGEWGKRSEAYLKLLH
jgi:Tfp pilus assembly protein PilF